jgi:hypothetical protein
MHGRTCVIFGVLFLVAGHLVIGAEVREQRAGEKTARAGGPVRLAKGNLPPHPLPANPITAPVPVYIGPPAPQYLILRQDYGGVAQPTVGQPYAYGWFGVSPRQHTITHTGYYGSHWLWPGRLPQ